MTKVPLTTIHCWISKVVTENTADILADSKDDDEIRMESLKTVLFSLGVIDMAERMKEVLKQ